jgi:cation diffusion facilitator family transporter
VRDHKDHNHNINNHNFAEQDKKIQKNEKKTFIVIVITFVMMVVEIFYGHLTQSMSLLADGWHMGSHVGALGISFFAYRLTRSKRLLNKLSFGTGKIIPLGGYTSAVGLGLVAFIMAVESIDRLLRPVSIQFDEAILVAVIGLIVNAICAFILGSEGHHHDHDHDHGDGHKHDHHHRDHNMQSAFMHVLADALTSVTAIVALLVGKYFNITLFDPLIGILGGIVILRWAYYLMRDTGLELLDAHAAAIDLEKLKELLKSRGADLEVLDLHVWKIAPSAHAAEIIVCVSELKGADFYREIILKNFSLQHLVIEERLFETKGR